MKKIILKGSGFLQTVLSGLLLLVSVNVWPQEPMVVPGLSGELTFDGVPDEGAWPLERKGIIPCRRLTGWVYFWTHSMTERIV